MDRNFIGLIIAALVMHFNQDMNLIYWIAVLVMVVTSLRIANNLDYGRTEKDNRED